MDEYINEWKNEWTNERLIDSQFNTYFAHQILWKCKAGWLMKTQSRMVNENAKQDG